MIHPIWYEILWKSQADTIKQQYNSSIYFVISRGTCAELLLRKEYQDRHTNIVVEK